MSPNPVQQAPERLQQPAQTSLFVYGGCLCVDSQHRSQGVGSRLIEHFEEVLFPAADNLYLFVSDINPDAIRLYVRLGYLQVGALPNFNLEMQTEFLHRKTRRPRQAAYMAQVRDATRSSDLFT